jgi:hypothetical protein
MKNGINSMMPNGITGLERVKKECCYTTYALLLHVDNFNFIGHK